MSRLLGNLDDDTLAKSTDIRPMRKCLRNRVYVPRSRDCLFLLHSWRGFRPTRTSHQKLTRLAMLPWLTFLLSMESSIQIRLLDFRITSGRLHGKCIFRSYWRILELEYRRFDKISIDYLRAISSKLEWYYNSDEHNEIMCKDKNIKHFQAFRYREVLDIRSLFYLRLKVFYLIKHILPTYHTFWQSLVALDLCDSCKIINVFASDELVGRHLLDHAYT